MSSVIFASSARGSLPKTRMTSHFIKQLTSIIPLLAVTTLFLSHRHANSLTVPSTANKRKQRPPILPWIACASSKELERAIRLYLRQNDTVLELGSQLSNVSATLAETIGPGGRAILADVARNDATSGRSRGRMPELFLQKDGIYHDRVTFVELHRFDEWRSLLEDDDDDKNNIRFDALILDISTMIGNDLHLTTISLVQEFLSHQTRPNPDPSTLRPRVLLIKSTSLSSLSRRLLHGNRLLNRSVSLPQRSSNRREEPYLIATVGVEDYRNTIPFVLKPDDTVLELGCHLGTTTALLHRVVQTEGYCLGVDIGPKVIQRATTIHPHVHFATCDAWNTAGLNRLLRSKRLDVAYADIGGLSGPYGLLESLALLDALGRALEPRCIVIKSLCVRRLASSLRPFSDILESR